MAQIVVGDNLSFAEIREGNFFYEDKTAFIRDWWNRSVYVDILSRPHGFGKSLSLSTLECFFSTRYKERGDLFEGLEIWEDEKFRALQGTIPVVRVSFARVKEKSFESAVESINSVIRDLLEEFQFIKESPTLSDWEKERFVLHTGIINETDSSRFTSKAQFVLKGIIHFLSQAEKTRVIVLLDDYDTPLREAWMHGYWDKMASFMDSFCGAIFKGNEDLKRGLLMGVDNLIMARSCISGFNNYCSSSLISGKTYDAFGFTDEEVRKILKQYKLSGYRGVKKMYGGFWGRPQDKIYNPSSFVQYLSNKGQLRPYSVKTNAQEEIEHFVKDSFVELKTGFVDLLQRKNIFKEIEDVIVFKSLEEDPEVVWTILVNSGYLSAIWSGGRNYKLSIPNDEERSLLEAAILSWFNDAQEARKAFIEALLAGNIQAMNDSMRTVLASCLYLFLPSLKASRDEHFYYSFILTLVVELRERFVLRLKRKEFDFGGWSRRREDIKRDFDLLLEPKEKSKDDAFILEFRDSSSKNLISTLEYELTKTKERTQYETQLVEKGVPSNRIRHYLLAFHDNEILVDDKSGEGRKAYREKAESKEEEVD